MRSLRFNLFVLACAVACALTRTVIAAPPPDSSTPDQKVEAFFKTIMQGDSAKALDILLDGSSIATNKPGAASTLRSQLQTGLSVYGKALGYDAVETKSFGESLARCVYILRLEKYPLTWEFFFYKSGETWMPIDVRFNDKLDVYRYDRVPTASDGASP